MSNNRPLIEQLKKLLLETDSVDVVDNLQEAHFELQTDALVSLWLSLASKMSNELGELTSEDLHNNEEHIRQEVIKYLTDRTGVNHIKVAIPLKGYSDCYLCIQIEWNDALFVGVMNDLSKKNEKLRSFGRKEGYIGDDKWWPMYKYIDYKGEWWHLKKLTPVQIQQLHDEKFVDEFANTLINELRDLKGFIESQS